MPKHHFKEGDAVRHKDNLEQGMSVSRILKETKEFVQGFNSENKPILKQGIRMIGIECHWWIIKDGNKTLSIHKFHSSELVPEEIALKGTESVKSWLITQLKK